MSNRWLPAETSPVELTIPHAAVLRAAWLERLAGHPAGEDVELDMSNVQEIDSAGVQLLLALRASLARRGARLALVAPSTATREALATLGVPSLLVA